MAEALLLRCWAALQVSGAHDKARWAWTDKSAGRFDRIVGNEKTSLPGHFTACVCVDGPMILLFLLRAFDALMLECAGWLAIGVGEAIPRAAASER
uniref:Putative secreted protein n=1 Tax=Anopheles darlingi TaxID=43151 RepID=A0A2M4DD25_ANODA